MRRKCRPGDLCRRGAQPTLRATVQPSAAAHGPPARFASSALKETPMTWETPTAIDMRFGFEITMYVTAR